MSSPDSNSPVRVLVTDDSAFMRTAISRMIESDESLTVVGTAQTGLEALDKIIQLQPDVVTLDVAMPGLNGLETLKRIMRESPLPVIMVSSMTQDGAETTLEALDLGAFDYVSKQIPNISLDIVKIRRELVDKIKVAAHSCFPSIRKSRQISPSFQQAPAAPYHLLPSIVVIGTSTGGPRALQEVLPALPAGLPVGILVVQHMPPGFTGPFAKRLDSLCNIPVHEAEDGMAIEHGHVYLAPAGKQMTLRRHSSWEAVLNIADGPANLLHAPSVDVTMISVAETYHNLAMGIIMTGMGADGALGMQAIFREGGLTIGQNEETCAVYGMPRSCAEMGILRRMVPLSEIPRQIMAVLGHHDSHHP